MKNKAKKVVLPILVLGVMFGIGYLFGTNGPSSRADEVEVSSAMQQEVPVEKKGEKKAKQVSKVIAMVNLDEGIVKQEQQMNYGNTLLNLIGAEVQVTGLEEARTGVETNRFGAYFIIPNTFSENIETISSTPQKSTLLYAISSELSGANRADVVDQVWEIYDSFRANISQIYTSSILREYHAMQDELNNIMGRDNKDLEMLNTIESHDLIDFIDIVELQSVEKNIEPLNIMESFSVNQEWMNTIEDAYRNGLQLGQERMEKIPEKYGSNEDSLS